jgi:hypothetical protein
MRNYVLLLAGVCLLQPGLAHAQATSKPQPPAPAATKPAAPGQSSAKPAPPAAAKKEIKVPEKVLKTYVGDYQQEERVLEIEFKDGSLWGAPRGQNKRQLFAESTTKFFLKDLPVQLTFQKDKKGIVTGLQMQQGDNPVRDMKKVK